MFACIVATLVILNNNYGRGDIVGVVMNDDYNGGIVTRKLAKLGTEPRRFRFNCATNTVYYAGHQAQIN